MKRGLVVLLLTSVISTTAHARLFDLASKSFGTYFGGNIGASSLGSQPWGDSSSTASTVVTTDQTERLNYAGEFGFILAVPKMNLRLGVEYLAPQHLSDIRGTDSSGQELFTLDSRTFALIPKAVWELVVYKTKETSLMFGAGIGYATVTMQNKYRMTSAGTTALSASSFTEKASGSALMGEGFVAYEFLLSDNVTVFTSVGYQYLVVNTLKHQNDATVIGGSTVAKGATVTNTNGEARSLNLSSGNAGLHFRFYF